jgi:thiosulfate reductase cytochrome b subunit
LASTIQTRPKIHRTVRSRTDQRACGIYGDERGAQCVAAVRFRHPGGHHPGRLACGALWHFAAMWVLALNGLIYLVYGILSGHFSVRSFR